MNGNREDPDGKLLYNGKPEGTVMKTNEILAEDGFRLHYDEYGTGSRVILSAQVGFYPKGLQQRLAAQGYHVYCLTQAEKNGKWYQEVKA